MEQAVRNILIDILRTVLNGEQGDDALKAKLTPDVLPSLLRLSKKHDVAHMVSAFLFQNEIEMSPETLGAFQREEMLSVFRYERMQYAFSEICDTFDGVGIAYVPLKGAVIRAHYPSESMRTSCDIDLLIHEEDLEKAMVSLEQKGYRCGDRAYHDVSLYSPNDIHLELHFHIQENMESLDSVLRDVWSYATLADKSRYVLSDEFFAFYLFAHMAYHFLAGGCGIRALMDLWVMEHRMGIVPSCAEHLLEQAGIAQFAIEMRAIAEQCFTHTQRDAFAETVLTYIFDGGIYGGRENRIAVVKSKGTNTLSYVLGRLFPPYRSMKISYPILIRVPVLLPFCWMARWFSMLFGRKTRRVMAEMSTVTGTTDEKIDEITQIRSRLGL